MIGDEMKTAIGDSPPIRDDFNSDKATVEGMESSEPGVVYRICAGTHRNSTLVCVLLLAKSARRDFGSTSAFDRLHREALFEILDGFRLGTPAFLRDMHKELRKAPSKKSPIHEGDTDPASWRGSCRRC